MKRLEFLNWKNHNKTAASARFGRPPAKPFQKSKRPRIRRGNWKAPKGRFDVLVIFAVVIIALLVIAQQTALQPGLPGPRGPAGPAGGGGGGGAGAPGDAGTDGFTALVITTPEVAGPNCDVSGQRIDSGLDNGDGGGTARNNQLEVGEYDFSSYVCDGLVGSDGVDGYDALVKSTAESPGVNCPNGGKKIETGLDNGDGGGVARDGILSAGEVDQFGYMCNGEDGTDGTNGHNSLVDSVTESPGVNCANGGKKVYSGLDNGDGGGVADNGVLEAGERDQTNYLCNGDVGATGASGYNALVISSAESAGANCADGGRKIQAGTDNGDGGGVAGDNTLQAGEIDTTGYACNGAPGRDSGLAYTYSTGTSGDPGSGKFGFDTVTLSAIATLRISETDGDANGISAILASWDDSTSSVRSTITVLGNQAPTRMLVFSITGAITDNGAYDSFPVAYVTSAGSHANNDVDKIRQARTGDKGDTGTAGTNGLNAGLLYTYSTGTSGDPGSGKFGFDTTTLSSIVTLRISETDGDGNGIASVIATWDDSTTTGTRSTITILGNGAPTRLLVFTITSAITDNGAYDSFTIAYVTSAGSWANNDIDRLLQARTGDKGADGTNGAGFSVTKALSSAATSTSTTGAEATGLNSGSLASGTYVATYYLVCRTAATGTGIDFGINFDNTQGIIVSQMRYQDSGSTASAGTADGTIGGDGSEGIIAGGSVITETTTAPNLNVITGVITASEDFLVIIEVVVTPTATGELELWFATDVASSQVDIRTGSSVTIIKTA